MIYTYVSIVVPLSVATALRSLGQALDRNETDGMFTTGLSPTGAAPATHFISCGQAPVSFTQAIRSPTLLDTQAQAAFAKASLTYPFSLAIITGALAGCSITDGTFNSLPEGPHQMIARLGLQIVRTAI